MAKNKPAISMRKPPAPTPAALSNFVASGDTSAKAFRTKKKPAKQRPSDGQEYHVLSLRIPADLHRELSHACIDRRTTLTGALLLGARLWLDTPDT